MALAAGNHRVPERVGCSREGWLSLHSPGGVIAYLRYISDPGVAERFMTTYTGSRTIDGIQVLVDGKPLDERYELKKFTKNGFEWTYEGAEPSQLALALLADHLGDGSRAIELCDPFMRRVIANLENEWVIPGPDFGGALNCVPTTTSGRQRAPATNHASIEASCWNSRCPSRLQNHPQNQYRASRRFAPPTSHPQPSRHCQIDEPEASRGWETYDRGWL